MDANKSSGFRVRGWILLAVALIVTGALGIIIGILTIQYDLSLRSLWGGSGADQISMADAWRRYSSNWIAAGFRIGLVTVGLLTALYGYRGERQNHAKPAEQVA